MFFDMKVIIGSFNYYVSLLEISSINPALMFHSHDDYETLLLLLVSGVGNASLAPRLDTALRPDV